jgi:hypothetical protein
LNNPPELETAIFTAEALYSRGQRLEGDAALASILDLPNELGHSLNDEKLIDLAATFFRPAGWQAALAIYRILEMRGRRQYGWLIAKLEWRIRNRESLCELFGNIEHQKRIRTYFENLLGISISHIDTKPSEVGFVAVTSYKHSLKLNGNGGELSIYEKVREFLDWEKGELERLLFENIDAQNLAAPKYYGIEKSGPFFSSFTDFVEGVPVKNDWPRVHADLIYKLWAIQPGISLKENASVPKRNALKILSRLKRTSESSKLDIYIDKDTIYSIKKAIDFAMKDIIERVNRMPLFIYHKDLHAGNTLINSSGEVTLFDWDQWSLEPIGFGWSPRANESNLKLIDLSRVRLQRTIPEDITDSDAMLMASISGYNHGIIKGKPALAAFWLRRLGDYL